MTVLQFKPSMYLLMTPINYIQSVAPFRNKSKKCLGGPWWLTVFFFQRYLKENSELRTCATAFEVSLLNVPEPSDVFRMKPKC